MAETIPTGYISLIDAIARAGPKVVPGWTGEEPNAHLWARKEPQGSIFHRWEDLEQWFGSRIHRGTLPLRILKVGSALEKQWERQVEKHRRLFLRFIQAKKLDFRAVCLVGRVTKATRQQAVDWLAGDQSSDEPMLLLEERALQDAIAEHLRPDDREYWSFAALLAWMCWRRHDKVRECADFTSLFIPNDIRTHHSDGAGIAMSWPDALRDLWTKLGKGDLRAWGLPNKDGAERGAIPPQAWQDFGLDNKDMIDVLVYERPPSRAGQVAYFSPSVSRENALAIWGDGAKRPLDAETSFLNGLITKMQSSPNCRIGRKEEYQTEAAAQGITQRAFDRLWSTAMRKAPAPAWGKGGAPKKEQRVEKAAK